ncbi:MAG: DUF1559 domain-containing protein [Planctomycetaceae bacterium]|nr:DUF1559 domain-containing protein [Planctomycetaceae bacterium]
MVVVAIIGVLIAILLPAVQAAREAANRSQCSNNQRQLALALHNHNDSNGSLPTSCTDERKSNSWSGNRPGSAWSYVYQLLPFIEQDALYDIAKAEYANHDGIRSTANGAAGKYISSFSCPSDDFADNLGGRKGINYMACDGDYSHRYNNSDYSHSRGAMTYRSFSNITQIEDGTSNTIVVSERAIPRAINDVAYRVILETVVVDASAVPSAAASATGFENAIPNNCTTLISNDNYTAEPVRNNDGGNGYPWTSGFTISTHFNTILPPNSPSCAARNDIADPMIQPPTSKHPNGVNAAFGDGSVRFVNRSINYISSNVSGGLPNAHPKRSGESDFGVWGALGTRNGGEAVTAP